MSDIAVKAKTVAKPGKVDLSTIKLRAPRKRLDTTYDFSTLTEVGMGFLKVPVAHASTVVSGAHGYAAEFKDKAGHPTIRFQSQKTKDKATVYVIAIA